MCQARRERISTGLKAPAASVHNSPLSCTTLLYIIYIECPFRTPAAHFLCGDVRAYIYNARCVLITPMQQADERDLLISLPVGCVALWSLPWLPFSVLWVWMRACASQPAGRPADYISHDNQSGERASAINRRRLHNHESFDVMSLAQDARGL